MKNPFRKRSAGKVGIVVQNKTDEICVPGYTSLDKNPEIMTACRRIAELIGTITIHLMSNTKDGDVRIVNELSKKIDIDPTENMTRSWWMESIVMTMLLPGKGNAIVVPKTRAGILKNLEPMAASRVSFVPEAGSYTRYKVLIDGKQYSPNKLLHFRHNPDLNYLWKGRGVTVALRDIAKNLKQAEATKNAFLSSKWKPSVIIKVDAFNDELADPEKRKKLLKDYIDYDTEGLPWVIPADQFQVEQIRPLTLSDLAISDSVEIDKKTAAAVIGVPAFLLGVGDFNREEWNSFVQSTVRAICTGIQQEMTKKLILSPDWYLRFNVRSLMDWDLKTLTDVFCTMGDRGYVDGNEARDAIGLSPREGLDELRILENYIPASMSGQQSKLVGNDGNGNGEE